MKTTFWLAEQWVLDIFWCMILNHPSKFPSSKYRVLNMQRILIIILSRYYSQYQYILYYYYINIILSKQSWKQAGILLSGRECDVCNEENWKISLFFRNFFNEIFYRGPALVIVKQINLITCLILQKFDFISKVKPNFYNLLHQ